jgi:hypothetical protein
MNTCRKPQAIALLFFILTSNLAFCDEEDISKIQQEAKRDAEKDVDRIEWMASGCVTFGLAGATSHLYCPDPPAERLVGKSPEYIEYYCQAYEVETKELQSKYARIGCCAGMILWPGTLLLILYIAGRNYHP